MSKNLGSVFLFGVTLISACKFDASNARATFLRSLQSKLLLSLQLQQSYLSRKSVIAFFYISHLLTAERNNRITQTKKV